MKERKAYVGTLNGNNSVWCDKHPDGAEIKEIITFYSPDNGNVFEKDGELFDNVVIKNGVKIEDYNEILDPRQENPDEP